MTERYWRMMTDKHFHLIYLGLHHHRNVIIERWLDIILAVISTGALGALIFCEEMQIILTVILALAQIVTAARPYLPFRNRMNALDKGICHLNIIYYKIESNWNKIVVSEMDDAEVNSLYYDFLKEWDKVDSNILKRDSLPRKKKFIEQASQENKEYFSIMFGGNTDE